MSKTAMSAKSVKFVHSAGDVPTTEHWVIIESESIHIPESGVWAPGHGYPAHNEEFITYTAYTDKTEFEAAVKEKMEDQSRYGIRPFRFIHVLPVIVKKSITVEFETPKS